jgi:murein DD-endopeptidase MepM/ murein hydrolase activator NlpD
VERDTVSPGAPEVNLSKTGDIFQEYLQLKLSGEGSTKAEVEVTSTSTQTHELYLNEQGQYSSNQFLSLKCGQVTYQVRVRLTDRAGNTSAWSQTQTLTTQPCPRCGYTGGEFQVPFRKGSNDQPVDWTITQDFEAHGGAVDLATTNQPNYGHGVPVYPIAPGTVEKTKYQGGIPGEYGQDNHILIDHGNGLKAWYVHFRNETDQARQNLPEIGDQVTPNTVIGHLGNTGKYETTNTGWAAGTHLHLKVLQDGEAIDPTTRWGSGSNVPESEQEWFCEVGSRGEGDLQNPWANYHKAQELGEFKLEIKKDRHGNISKHLQPSPKITYLDTRTKENQLITYGLGIYKNSKMKVKIQEQVCSWGEVFGNCFLGKKHWQTKKTLKSENIDHAEIKLHKENNPNQTLAQLWNDDPPYTNGKFYHDSISIGTSDNQINYGQKLCVKSIIHGNLDGGSDWWENVDYWSEVGGGCREVAENDLVNLVAKIKSKHNVTLKNDSSDWTEEDLLNLDAVFGEPINLPKHFYPGSFKIIKRNSSIGATNNCTIQDTDGDGLGDVGVAGFVSKDIEDTFVLCSWGEASSDNDIGMRRTVIHELVHNYQKKLVGKDWLGNQKNIKFGKGVWDDTDGKLFKYYDIIFNLNNGILGVGKKWELDSGKIDMSRVSDPCNRFGDYFVSTYQCQNAARPDELGYSKVLPEEEMAESISYYYTNINRLNNRDEDADPSLNRSTFIENNFAE